MMAQALAENGAAAVYIVGRREDKLREAAARYPRYIHAYRNITADSTCPEPDPAPSSLFYQPCLANSPDQRLTLLIL